VSEKEVHQIKIGNKVRVEIEAFNTDNKLYEAKVISIAEDQNKNQSKYIKYNGYYRVVAELKSKISYNFKKFRNGYRVKGYIISDSGTIASLLWKYLLSS